MKNQTSQNACFWVGCGSMIAKTMRFNYHVSYLEHIFFEAIYHEYGQNQHRKKRSA